MDPFTIINRFNLEPGDLPRFSTIVSLLMTAPENLEEQLISLGADEDDPVYVAAKECVTSAVTDYYQHK